MDKMQTDVDMTFSNDLDPNNAKLHVQFPADAYNERKLIMTLRFCFLFFYIILSFN